MINKSLIISGALLREFLIKHTTFESFYVARLKVTIFDNKGEGLIKLLSELASLFATVR